MVRELVKKIVITILLSITLAPMSFAKSNTYWGTATLVSALTGASCCAYSVWKIKELETKLDLIELLTKEETHKIIAQIKTYKTLAWIFGAIGGAGAAGTVLCGYKWATQPNVTGKPDTPEQPNVLEQYGLTEQDLLLIKEIKNILKTGDSPPETEELETILSNQKLIRFLRKIDNEENRDDATKKIMLLKYCIIGQKRHWRTTSFMTTHGNLAKDANNLGLGWLGQQEMNTHFRTASLAPEQLNYGGCGCSKREKIKKSNTARKRAGSILRQLEENEQEQSEILSSRKAIDFFGPEFNPSQRAKMIEIAKNLADDYVRLLPKEK
ncbi:hypothetical protein KKA53_01095 [Candidatus Dependentiae bacterium]|nr:hypothetical protein [Candidatus Dependentiae bacterium]